MRAAWWVSFLGPSAERDSMDSIIGHGSRNFVPLLRALGRTVLETVQPVDLQVSARAYTPDAGTASELTFRSRRTVGYAADSGPLR